MGINYLMVLVGGAMGAVCRCAVSIQMKRILSSEFPIATFLINLTGSFPPWHASGFQCWGHDAAPARDRIPGRFTTFSTFQVENVALLRKGSFGTMLLYATLSVGLSVAFAFSRICAGRLRSLKLSEKVKHFLILGVFISCFFFGIKVV